MPPDGYDTVTLPTDLVQEVDSLPLGDSRTAIVRSLVAYYREGESGDTHNADAEGLDEIRENASKAAARTKRIEDEVTEIREGLS